MQGSTHFVLQSSCNTTQQAAPYRPTPIFRKWLGICSLLRKISYRLWTGHWKMPSSMPSKIWFNYCNPIQIIEEGQEGSSYTHTCSVFHSLMPVFFIVFQTGKTPSEFSNPNELDANPNGSSSLCRRPHSSFRKTGFNTKSSGATTPETGCFGFAALCERLLKPPGMSIIQLTVSLSHTRHQCQMYKLSLNQGLVGGFSSPMGRQNVKEKRL